MEVRGTSPKELPSWLWDFDAHRRSNQRTRGISRHTRREGRFPELVSIRPAPLWQRILSVPFRRAFSPDGKIGIFESNSIMRAVARLGESEFPLYGCDAYEASRIDSFLDASLVFAARFAHLPAVVAERNGLPEIHPGRATASRSMAGINQALSPDREFMVGDSVTIAESASWPNWPVLQRKGVIRRALKERASLRFCTPGSMPNFRAFAHFARTPRASGVRA